MLVPKKQVYILWILIVALIIIAAVYFFFEKRMAALEEQMLRSPTLKTHVLIWLPTMTKTIYTSFAPFSHWFSFGKSPPV